MLGFFRRKKREKQNQKGLDDFYSVGNKKRQKELLEEARIVSEWLKSEREKRRKQLERISVIADNLIDGYNAVVALTKYSPEELYEKDPETFFRVVRYLKSFVKKTKAEKTKAEKPKIVSLEGSSFVPNYENKPSVVLPSEKKTEMKLLPSERRALEIKEKQGYRDSKGNVKKNYKDIEPISLEGPLFEPEYLKSTEKTIEDKSEKAIEKSERLDEKFRIQPFPYDDKVSFIPTLEELVSFYDNDSFKLIERKNGKIVNIKVDDKLYSGFLNRIIEATKLYLEVDKGRRGSNNRKFFESLEDAVLNIFEEGFFNIESRIDPLISSYRTSKDENTLSYNERESFEKQYDRVLYSSLDSFEGSSDEEKRFSKAKSLVSLLGKYIAYNTGNIDRKIVLEYSRRINEYINNIFKKAEKKSEKGVRRKISTEMYDSLKIKVSLEGDVLKLYNETKSRLIYNINNNRDKVQLVRKQKRKKSGRKINSANIFSYVRDGFNNVVASAVASPVYLAGAVGNLFGRGIEELGNYVKKTGERVLKAGDSIREGLTRKYYVVGEEDYKRLEKQKSGENSSSE